MYHSPLMIPTLAVIPSFVQQWLVQQPQWVLLLIGAASLAAVIKGADLLVEGAAGIAKKFGMPEVVIGATIVSLGTTTPEMAVSVLAAFRGEAGLALGNGVGSIIADTGLIFALGCLMVRLPADRFILARQGWVQFGVAALLAVICYAKFAVEGNDATIRQWTGLLFVALLVWYLWQSVRWAKQHPGPVVAEVEQDPHVAKAAGKSGLALILIGVIGLAMVVFAGGVLIESIKELTLRWGVPEVVVAGTLVALGTSLPELMVAIVSIRKGHPELLVGNVIGADILNVLFVIGLSSLAAPLPIAKDYLPDGGESVTYAFIGVHLPIMLAMLILFRLFIFRSAKRGQFSKWMGLPLLVLYVAFIVLSFAIGGLGGH